MARPKKTNVDYFPFLCKEGRAMFLIESKYGNDGYATWIKILRQLAVTNYHYLNLSNETELMFLYTKCKVSETLLIEIIEDLCKLGELHFDLWKKHKVIYSEKFTEHIQHAYVRREKDCVTINLIYQQLNIIPQGEIEEPKKDQVPPKKEHDLFPKVMQSNEQLFTELENGDDINLIAIQTNIPLVTIKSKIPDFKKKANISYKSKHEFFNHFKNWILKNQTTATSLGTTTPTTEIKLGKHG